MTMPLNWFVVGSDPWWHRPGCSRIKLDFIVDRLPDLWLHDSQVESIRAWMIVMRWNVGLDLKKKILGPYLLTYSGVENLKLKRYSLNLWTHLHGIECCCCSRHYEYYCFFLSKFILFFILKLSNSNDTQMAHWHFQKAKGLWSVSAAVSLRFSLITSHS